MVSTPDMRVLIELIKYHPVPGLSTIFFVGEGKEVRDSGLVWGGRSEALDDLH